MDTFYETGLLSIKENHFRTTHDSLLFLDKTRPNPHFMLLTTDLDNESQRLPLLTVKEEKQVDKKSLKPSRWKKTSKESKRVSVNTQTEAVLDHSKISQILSEYHRKLKKTEDTSLDVVQTTLTVSVTEKESLENQTDETQNEMEQKEEELEIKSVIQVEENHDIVQDNVNEDSSSLMTDLQERVRWIAKANELRLQGMRSYLLSSAEIP
jgi:hypothetical protein